MREAVAKAKGKKTSIKYTMNRDMGTTNYLKSKPAGDVLRRKRKESASAGRREPGKRILSKKR